MVSGRTVEVSKIYATPATLCRLNEAYRGRGGHGCRRNSAKNACRGVDWDIPGVRTQRALCMCGTKHGVTGMPSGGHYLRGTSGEA
jgi:hypothetical protein